MLRHRPNLETGNKLLVREAMKERKRNYFVQFLHADLAEVTLGETIIEGGLNEVRWIARAKYFYISTRVGNTSVVILSLAVSNT